MLRTIWLKTLREYWIAVLCWGLGLGLLIYAMYATAQDALSAGVTQIYQSFSFYGDQVALNTIPGYVTFRVFGTTLPAFLAIWAILAGARLVRGDEERGTLDVLLSQPLARIRLLLEKLLALMLAILVMMLIISLFILLGQLSAKQAADYPRALLTALNVGLFELIFASIALLISQFVRWRGAAAGWTAAVLVIMFVFDSVGRVQHDFDWLRRLSIFYYYNANKPLIPSVATNWGALTLLVLLAAVLIVASALLFARRDLGGVAFQLALNGQRQPATVERARALARAAGDPFLRSLGLRTLRAQFTALFWWTVITLFFVEFLTALIPSLLDVFRKAVAGNAVMSQLFSGYNVATNQGFLGATVFAFVPVALTIFALTLASSWSRDLDNNRLEIILSMPQSRLRLLAEHASAVILASLIPPLLMWLSLLVTANIINLRIDVSDTAAACFSMLPLEWLTAALVYLLATRLPSGLTTGLISVFLALSFLMEFLQPMLKLPEWLINLSIFHLYGSPITEGWRWGPTLTILGLTLVVGLAAFLHFRQSSLVARA
ncbi:MAG: ABC transporter permease subunit [Thermogemmatispora sp.]|uniref:ABC transporter permease subunit n=1 Tax=Thermogemmatispora sp. TaxID=1968838 RepID=UPI001A0DC445|nr:ABC transporter permease subunit [Thermogemmatispora sp.]MBE3564331.1 ABC transporter permease subunit [Thermogemmatispora sp.]